MTLKDIAEKSGVSVMTVSNVINNKKNVSEKTRQYVLEVIEKNNYIPNSTARSLSAKSSRIILIVLPEQINSKGGYYSTTLLTNIEKYIVEENYFTMVYSKKDFNQIYNLIVSWNIDGVIFLAHSYSKEILDLKRKTDKPILMFDNPPLEDELLYINVDDYYGGYLQTKELIELGHKKIGFASFKSSDDFVMKNRFFGYKQALVESSIEFNEELVFNSGIKRENGIELAKKIIKSKKITALVATADMLAVGVMEEYKNQGLKIPEDLSIIGFDDLEICEFVSPKLSSISQSLEKKAFESVKMIINKINNQYEDANYLNIGVKLIKRDSTKRKDD